MRRREFIALVSGAAAWPSGAAAQRPRVPVIGVLGTASSKSETIRMDAFREGIAQLGYVEGRNLAIEYRGAEGQYDRLPALATELVRREVSVIATFGNIQTALAAKSATTDIPIVFMTGAEPLRHGLVTSFNHPGTNITGVTLAVAVLGPKRLEVLREAVPKAAVIGLLVNPTNVNAELNIKDAQTAGEALGQRLVVVRASAGRDFETAFATLSQERVGALSIDPDALFLDWREHIVALAAQQAIAAVYPLREFAVSGGLMSYGTNVADAYRRVGVYVGRILKGERAADLPVQQSDKVELVINLKTAKSLGLIIPPTLLARADEVIE